MYLFYPLKTSEKRKVFWCYPGAEKWITGNEWVNIVGGILDIEKNVLAS